MLYNTNTVVHKLLISSKPMLKKNPLLKSTHQYIKVYRSDNQKIP